MQQQQRRSDAAFKDTATSVTQDVPDEQNALLSLLKLQRRAYESLVAARVPSRLSEATRSVNVKLL